MSEEKESKTKIFSLRVTTGREKQVIDKLEALIKKNDYPIYSILKPSEIRGYFFIEADDIEIVRRAVYGIHHVKGVVKGKVGMDEIKHFFAPLSQVINIEQKDIVELIGGPFKGERAKVQRVNKMKETVTVEPLEAAVPIPVTVRIDDVRLIQKKEQLEE